MAKNNEAHTQNTCVSITKKLFNVGNQQITINNRPQFKHKVWTKNYKSQVTSPKGLALNSPRFSGNRTKTAVETRLSNLSGISLKRKSNNLQQQQQHLSFLYC